MAGNSSKTLHADDVPVARPALPLVADLPSAHETDDALVPEPARVPWLTPESVRGWTTSLSAHALILVIMMLWVLRTRSEPPRLIETRLAGDPNGVDEGLTLTGGLNSELDLVVTPEPEPDPRAALEDFKPLDIEAIAPKLTGPSVVPAAEVPSVAGGADSKNPGAGSGDGFGLARFGQGGETIRGVAVKVGDPQFTLLWDSEVDLDLHVIEPGGKEIFWEDPKGKLGGELDVDNTKGFGPENVYWLHEDPDTGARVQGTGPPGEYRWFVVYWGGFGGIPKPTNWRVRIKHAGKVTVVKGKFRALNERSRVYTLKVEPNTVAGAVTERP